MPLHEVLRLMEILGCRSEENSYNILPSAATMLFHGLPGGDVHGVVEEMDRRGKSESAAISSAIDMGESETVGEISFYYFQLIFETVALPLRTCMCYLTDSFQK